MVTLINEDDDTLRTQILKTCNEYTDPFTMRQLLNDLKFYLNLDNDKFRAMVADLENDGYIINEGNGIYKLNIKKSRNELEKLNKNELDEFQDFFDFNDLSESDSFKKHFNETEEVINFKYNDEYIQLLKDDNPKAVDNLVKANSKLVWKIVKRYSYAATSSFTLDDMFIEGEMGLMRAIKKFDPSKGYELSTYATYWIMQGITRAISNQSLSIRIPVHMYEKISKLTKCQKNLEKELNREPTIDEVSHKMGISIEDVIFCKMIYSQFLNNLPSLDKFINDENDTNLEDIIPKKQISIEELVENEDLKEQIDKILNCLKDREKVIMELRYGINCDREHTLEEIGEKFNLSRERIRQIESKVLKQIKKSQLRKYIDGWY